MSEQMMTLLQHMDSYIGYRDPLGKTGSCWLKKVKINPVRQLWMMQVMSLAPLDQEQTECLRRSLCESYEQQEILLEVIQPTTLQEAASCWPLWVEALETEFHPADPQVGEMEALMNARIHHKGDSLVISVGEMTNIRHHDQLGALLARRLSEALGRTIQVMFDMPLVLPASQPEKNAQPEKPAPARRPRASKAPVREEGDLIYGRTIRDEPIPMGEVGEESGRIAVEGVVFKRESRQLKSGKYLFTFALTDYTGSISSKLFLEEKDLESVTGKIKEGQWLRVGGDCQYDSYAHEVVLRATGIRPISPVERMDNAQEKRVELHLHTQMSSMDGLTPIKEVVQRAAKWGHPALAITDHGVVQAFPDAYEAAHKAGIKLILGMEAYMVADRAGVIRGPGEGDFHQSFVVFDIETTGLDKFKCGITEIGAVRVQDGKILDTFESFVNPGMPIPSEVVHLTGITDAMVADAPEAAQVLQDFAAFCGDSVLVAHNAAFDIGFIRYYGRMYGLNFANPVLDTLALSRSLYPHVRSHKLNDIAKRLNVTMIRHHRASDDAATCAGILDKLLAGLAGKGVDRLELVNQKVLEMNPQAGESFHTVVLVKNHTGLRNLYELVSEAHLHHLYRGKPRIPKHMLAEKREGLIIGSACEAGELFRAMLRGDEPDELERIASFYDYLEIQPIGNNAFLIREGEVADEEGLRNLNRQILQLGKRMGKPVVGTGDVHFLNPQDEYYRRILMHGQKFSDADFQAPLYFRTTQEMLDEFDYLDSADQYKVVIGDPQAIAAQVEEVAPLPPYKLYAPTIEGAQDEVVSMSYNTAKARYGDPLPEIVEKRLEKELASITGYGFSVLYLIASRLVTKSMSDGYLVGSRGSVGSSLVATMTGITEINALPPHYRCPQCQYSNFDVDTAQYPTGPDLPDADCPRCGHKLVKDGYDIPFEVFLGFKGDKVPDIDLNFGGEYQSRAHAYTEVLLGKGNVFRAGTIGTIAEKTAYGYVKNYLAEHNKVVPRAEEDRLTAGCTGVKRTTGQHPGGIIVVPDDMSIYDFSPIQYPADDAEGGTITTHFDFNSLHDRLVKLDILGHDDPTMLRMLQDLTGIDPKTRPLDDPGVLSLFQSPKALGVTPEQIGSNTGTLGIPEFGTAFVRQMLEDTHPTTVSELIRIAGLSHGTDVWLNNAQEKVREGVTTLKECIATRDDIMLALIRYGVESKMAFDTMESVRKGKGLKPEMEAAMAEHNVPEWFVDSCKKIKYMFPKGHAAAYVMMSLRVAWYKVYQPKAYYTAYYTVRADEFDASIMCGSLEAVQEQINRIQQMGKEASAKDANVMIILELVREMLCRGIVFDPIDLYESDATRFLMTDTGIRPPLNAIPGLGSNAAQAIVQAREEGRFLSIEDLKKRGKVSSSVLESMKQFRILDGMTQTNQISLFDNL